MEKYYAKSPNIQGQMETVQHHLLRTGELCSAFLSVLGWKDVGEILGKLHDFGKYSILFQQVLKGLRVHVNHAYPGAALALNSYGQGRSQTAKMMAMAIAAHHSQLNQDCLDTLRRLMRGEGDREDSCGNSLSLFGREEMQQSALLFRQELSVPRLASSLISSEEENTPLSRMLCARFLLSALADADYSSSAEHNDPDYLSTHTGSEFNAAAALERLMELRRQKQKNSTASGPLNRLRDQLFEDCLTAAQQPPGIFRLTAPTGLGKTLSLFAFAAQHCQLYKKRRVILVLPFLAVTEQNGRDYSAVEPRLLESHSAAELSEEARGWSERWSAPCIVTTNVGFFEPLFSAKPTACRRLHQIANSVIVLDEAQSLPSHLLDATLRTLQTLCRSYGCTVVLSTATQPSFEYLPNINWMPREIVPNPQHLFQVTQRVAYHWRIDRPTPLPQIAAELSEKNCGCAIFNLRAHAKSLYRQLCQLCGPEDVFYLSTDLCTAHRRVVLERVKSRITQGRRCYLAATQCIEAGVDLDFPLVYRALAPLEAIIQAAGRCNRNGAALTGRVEVFVPDEPRLYPPDGHYEEAANCVAILASRHPVECSNLDHIKEYYQLLYSNAKGDDPVLKRAIEQEDFSGVQEAYRLIRSKGVEVIVPFSQQMELFQNIQEEYDRFGFTPSLLKKARSLIVSSFYEQEVKDHCIPLWFRSPEGEKTPVGCYMLCDPAFYTDGIGLDFEQTDNIQSIW